MSLYHWVYLINADVDLNVNKNTCSHVLTQILYIYKGVKKEKWRDVSGNFIMKRVFEELKNEERKIEK